MTKRKPATGERSFAPAIAECMAASLLPFDAELAGRALAEAARFVAAAAEQRGRGTPAIAVESVTTEAGVRFTRVAVINDNMPFLVDSIAGTIGGEGLGIDRIVHPVVWVERDAKGRLTAILGDERTGALRESMVYVEAARVDARARARLTTALMETLADVRAAVHDWPRLKSAMAADAERLGTTEGAALLRWLGDDMLTQLGHVVRHADGSQSDALGICRAGAGELLSPSSYARAFAWFKKCRVNAAAASAPLIVKSNKIGKVHRRVPLDLFLVPRFDGDRVAALSVHAGVWTSSALASPPTEVPRLRAQLAALTEKFGADPRGHTGKAVVHAVSVLPDDLLIGFEDPDFERVITSMMSLIDRPRPRLILVRPPLERHLFAFVWLPRDALSTAVRLQIRAMLETAAKARTLDWSQQVEGSLALIRFMLDIRDGGPVPDEGQLDARLHAMVRGWAEAVEAELAELIEPSRAKAIAGRYAEAFPLAYRATGGPAEAARDICRLYRRSGRENAPGRDARLRRLELDPANRLRLKIYQRQGSLLLSDAVPVLEHFGFRVIKDVPTELDLPNLVHERLGAIHDFTLALPQGQTAEALIARAEPIESAIAAVLNGDSENDPFNVLIVTNGLSLGETNWLRAWYRYLRQAGMTYGSPTVVEALQHAPGVTRGLIDLFLARHDPSFAGDRADAEAKALGDIRDGLAKVAAINHDRLLRSYSALIQAMLRTNVFVRAGQEALAFKLDSALVPGLPRPVPWREIFVYSTRVEGIHLRAGPVARGGIRWSDRRDDFRTEVLGLMKAQRVKNAVIVPTGAKGGFYAKNLPDPLTARDAWLVEGKASYEVFIRALLSLTDNIVGRRVVHPKGIVVRDGDDPYFVVAADKGTATFSDTANALAAERDFWLDDAFASGGSKGYDHKAMGITARGAWISVQRHFRELGVDVQRDPVRVVGCGDMSGDVFGNGMLLSQAIKLVAAFDHRHIFLDPDPDAGKSWAERKRLFDLPRSSWDDYDRKLISKGGGVFARTLKDIPLSPQVREVLGIEAESADPDTLIAAILRSPVDLLWFGGIGSYVKSSAENNVAVGDPANDALRVDGREVRARVVGEGANLGCTQAGRIEYALAGADGSGGRINTDFIDNSAGVDCSDHEVNIKIALASAKRDGRIGEKARVNLLMRMTEDVAADVLEDNRLQALALSIAESGGAAGTGAFIHLIEALEARGQLDRKTAGLADNETLLRRAADGYGLTRPELAVLLSSAKLALQGALEAGRVPDDPGLEGELLAAFPPAMRSRFKHDVEHHRLRREIIATRVANRIVNRIGMIHPFELAEEEGATLSQVASAFLAAERLFGLDALWADIEIAEMPETARIVLMRRTSNAVRTHMADLLRAGAGSKWPSAMIADLAPGIAQLRNTAAKLLGEEARSQSERMCTELLAAGAPAAQATLVTRLFELDGAVGLTRLSLDTGVPVGALTAAFTDIGARLGLDWVQASAAHMRPPDPWERLLVAGLARDFQQMRLDFLRRIGGRKGGIADAVSQWLAAQETAVAEFRAGVARMQAIKPVAPAMLAQIASQARNLLAR